MRLARLAAPATLSLALLVAPLAAEAQPTTKTPLIGWIGNGSPPVSARLEAIRQGLRELGWVEGQTVTIESRWAGGNPDRLPALIADLVRLKADVIVVAGAAAIRAARSVTSTVPIVFVSLADPVTEGFVQTLARPGGNMTGVASEYDEIIGKQLELLKEAVPSLSRVVLLNRPEGAPAVLSAAKTAAGRLGLSARTVMVADVAELESPFRSARSDRVGAILVLPAPFFDQHRRQLVELAARYRLPAIYEFRDYVEDGGLMSYGPSINEMFRSTGSYLDRILKGAKPGDLPIERPNKFELVINLKTAKALGLTISPTVLARSDEIIQ
jgi:putative ABC transport system substrate-binding protein